MKILFTGTVVLAAAFTVSSPVHAGCNCGGGFGGPMPMPVMPYDGFGSVAAYGQYMNFGGNGSLPDFRVHGPHPNQLDGVRYPVPPPGGAAAANGLVPFVPGTLGQTYTKTSHPIPDEKHPRTAMLAVRDMGTVSHMSIRGMSGFRMSNGVWLFETDRPVVPWVESLVRVEARNEQEDIEPYRISFVRLIPGRIVYLDFQ
ncbi:MAG: hypothetical protein KDA89_05230 [Planctomycetaceae bacterium]|nr:hypothetical protein [Planctomycetaceae bacterium]